MISKFFRKKRYVSEQWLKCSLKNQFEANSKTVEQILQLKSGRETRMKLQFFFYTNTSFKARKLAQALKELNYEVDPVDRVTGEKLWVISGWSESINMDASSVTRWTSLMNHLGFEYDCGFDGWGAYTD